MFPDIHKGAELAFKVIKEREDQTLNEMAALRAEIKTRAAGDSPTPDQSHAPYLCDRSALSQTSQRTKSPAS